MTALLAETMPAGGAEEYDDDEEESLSALRPAFRDGTLAKLLLWFLLFEISGNWVDSVIPLYASDRGILSASGVGLLFAYGSGLTVCLQMLVSRMTERRSALWLTAAAGIISIAGFLLLIASASLDSLIGAVSLCFIAQMLVGPLVPTAITALAPDGKRASYMAAASVANDLKDTLGPSFGTALYALAPRLPWIVGIPLVALASFGLGLSLRKAEF